MTTMAHPALSIGIEAQNFFKVLSLIDRTILPRRLFLANDTAELVLAVARQRASLEGKQTEADAATPKSLADAIARLCAFGRSVTHRLETASPRRSAHLGFPAIAIVNALSEGAVPGEYRFSRNGWPLAAPAGSSFTGLTAAVRIASAMSRWQQRHGDMVEPPLLLLAVLEGLPGAVSISVEDGLTVTTTPPEQLGQFVSRWPNR
jgi:hypothetical protein